MNADDVIQATVDSHENFYRGDPAYRNAVRQAASINLAVVTTPDVQRVVQPFLYTWGRMGRVLGKTEYTGWQHKVQGFLQANNVILGLFRGKRIENEQLSAFKSQIDSLYASLEEAVGPIASAKILNLFCPSFFPLWDTAIASGVRAEIAALNPSLYKKGISALSADDYFLFMHGIQTFVRAHNQALSSLSARYTQEKLRIVDECFWWTVKRPFSLMF